jgi:hypothetical protein
MGQKKFTELMGVESFVHVHDSTGAAVPENDLFAGTALTPTSVISRTEPRGAPSGQRIQDDEPACTKTRGSAPVLVRMLWRPANSLPGFGEPP